MLESLSEIAPAPTHADPVEGGVAFHTGDGVAESMDAAAVAIGSDIHFHPAAVHPTLGPEPGLLRHELMHVAQQRAGEAGEGEHADEAALEEQADAAGRGERVATPLRSGRRPLRHGFVDWFARNFDFATLVEQANRAADREATTIRQPDTYLGTNQPVAGTEERAVCAAEQGTDSGPQRTSLGGFEQVQGSRVVLPGVTGPGSHTSVDQTTTRRDHILAPTVATTENGTETTVLDTRAMARAARSAITDNRDHARTEATRLQGAIDRRTSELRRTTPTQGVTAALDADPELRRMRGELDGHRQRGDRMDAELANVSEDTDAQGLLALAQRTHMAIRPQYRVERGDMTRTTSTSGLDGLGHTTGRREERDVHHDDGTRDRTINNDTATFDLRTGQARGGSDTTSEHTNADGTGSRVRTATTHTIGVGSYGRSDEQSYRETGADGRTTSESSTRSSTTGSVVAGPDGNGVRGVRERTRSVTEDGVTRSTTNRGTATVTDRGVSGSYDHEQTRTEGGRQTKTNVSPDGSFSIDITPIDENDARHRGEPQAGATLATRFEVKMKLHLGLSAGRSDGTAPAEEGSTSARSTVSASVTGRASADMTYVRVMSLEEVRAYLVQADATAEGGAAGGPPEFGLLARLRAMRGTGDRLQQNAAAVAGSAEAAAGLRGGESVELALSGEVGGSLSVGRENQGLGAATGSGHETFGASASVNARLGWSRTVRIERVSGTLIDVTVRYEHTDSRGYNAGVSVSGVGMSHGSSTDSSSGESVRVRLDTASPTYAADYHRCCSTLDPTQLRDLAREYTSSHGHGDTSSNGVSAPGVSIGGSETQRESDSVTVNRDDQTVTGTVSGSNINNLGVTVAGVQALQSNRTVSADATVDAAGLDVTLSDQRSASDVGGNLASVPGAMVPRDAASALQSPQDRLKKALEDTEKLLDQWSISEGEITRIASMTGNRERWVRFNVSTSTMAAWESFRRALASPSINAEWSAIDPAGARRLALGQAVTHFIASSGPGGMDCIVNLMRGDDGSLTGGLMGVHLQWPPSIARARADYESARSRVRLAGDRFRRMVGQENAQVAAQTWVADTHATLDRVLGQVQGCNDFSDSRAKLEMVDSIQRLGRDLDATMREHLHALASGRMENAPEAPLESRADALSSEAPALPEAERQATERIADLTGQLQSFHAQEVALFGRARAVLPASQGGALGSVRAIFSSDYVQAHQLMHSVADLHSLWIARIQEMRAAYRTVHTPEAQWVVSPSPGGARRPNVEPDVEQQCRIMLTDTDSNTAGGTFTRGDRMRDVAAWRSRARSY